MFFHTSPVTKFRLPNSLAKRSLYVSKARPPTPRSVSATRNLILASGSSGFAKPVLSATRERDQRRRKRESTPMVACGEEDRVRLARSHCVRRHLCARGVLHLKCEPIVHEPTVSHGTSESQSTCCCSLNVNQHISSSNRPNTLETPCC